MEIFVVNNRRKEGSEMKTTFSSVRDDQTEFIIEKFCINQKKLYKIEM